MQLEHESDERPRKSAVRALHQAPIDHLGGVRIDRDFPIFRFTLRQGRHLESQAEHRRVIARVVGEGQFGVGRHGPDAGREDVLQWTVICLSSRASFDRQQFRIQQFVDFLMEHQDAAGNPEYHQRRASDESQPEMHFQPQFPSGFQIGETP